MRMKQQVTDWPRSLRRALGAVGVPIYLAIARRFGTRRNAVWASYRSWQHLERGNVDSAMFYAEAAIAFDATLPDGYRRLALARQRRGDVAGALLALAQGRRLAPTDLQLLLATADVEFASGRYAEAEAIYRSALILAPAYEKRSDLVLALGVAVSRQGRVDEAASLLESAWEAAPAEPRFLAALGAARLRQGNAAEAARLLEAAMRGDPADADASYNLGLALTATGRRAEALVQARRALALRPDDAEFRELVRQLEAQMSGPVSGAGRFGMDLGDSP